MIKTTIDKRVVSSWNTLASKVQANSESITVWPDPPTANRPTPGGKPENDESGFMAYFSGTEGQLSPNRLILDSRLTPLERNGWLVFRMLFAQQRTAAPRYQDLQPYLSQVPCGSSASRDAVSRVIAILRMTGWLTLTTRGRDSVTGRVLGNLYALHGEPIMAAEHMLIDPGFVDLVEKNLKHSTKAIQIVATNVAQELRDHAENGTALPLRLETLIANLELNASLEPKKQGNTHAVRNPDSVKKPQSGIRTLQNPPSSESGLGEKTPVRNPDSVENTPSPESGLGLKATEINRVRIPDSRTYSTIQNTYVCNVLYVNPRSGKQETYPLQWPSRLDTLIDNEQRISALRMLEHLEPELQQQVIVELDRHCQSKKIRNPLGYLHGIVAKAERGNFNSVKHKAGATPSAAPPFCQAAKTSGADSHNPPEQPTSRVNPNDVPEFRELMKNFKSSRSGSI